MDASYIILSYVLHIFKGRRHRLHTQCICWLGLAAEVVEKYDGFLVTITAREKLESDAATGANEVIEFVGNDNEGCTVGNYTALPVNSRLIPMIETDK